MRPRSDGSESDSLNDSMPQLISAPGALRYSERHEEIYGCRVATCDREAPVGKVLLSRKQDKSASQRSQPGARTEFHLPR